MTDPIDELIDQLHTRKQWPRERRRNARTKHNISFRELGEALGVSHTAIYTWEKANGHSPQTREIERRYYDLLTKLEELP